MKPERPRPAPEGRTRASGARGVVCAAVILSASITAPCAELAAAPKAESKIKGIERALKSQRNRADTLSRKADEITGETAELSRKLVELGRESQSLEQRTADLKAQLTTIADRRRTTQLALERQHDRLVRLLAALQRIARNPPEVVFAYSGSPQDTLRSALLLKSILPRIEAQAKGLSAELRGLRTLRKDAAGRAAALVAASSRLAAKHQKIDRLIARKKALARATRAEQRRAEKSGAKLAAEAKSLRGLLRRIEKKREARQAKRPRRTMPTSRPPAAKAQRPAAATAKTPRYLAFGKIPSIAAARGKLVVPVVGRLVARFGKKRTTGARSQGLSFVTAAGARVVAPHGGRVAFAGPFRGYGRLLIIDNGEGYHTLLAGLGRIDVVVDQRLLSGEPIGIMALPGNGKPRLYMELRHNGRPVDPLPWLAATPTDKASG